MKDNHTKYRLYGITDNSAEEELLQKVELAAKGGMTILQYRDKKRDADSKEILAKKLKKICHNAQVLFCINDDVDLAKKIKADAVHLGQDDMDCKEARKIVGEDMLIGITAKTIEQAKKAEEDGADYIGSGAMFGSVTKENALPMSFETLQEICRSVKIPVVAIGGITLENAISLKDLPIGGIAVSNGLFGQDDIEMSAKKFRNMFER